MRKRFLKLVEEHDPKQKLYTVTLTDPYGEVENQFAVSGGDYAFDEFQIFKDKMTGESEDNEFQSELDRRAEAKDPEAMKAKQNRENAYRKKLQEFENQTAEFEEADPNVV